MKRYLFSTIMLLLMLIISACGSKDSIVGSWENSEGETIIFEKDGRWDVYCDWLEDDEIEGGGTYTLSGNILTLHYDDGGYVDKCNVKKTSDKVLKITPIDENGNEIPDEGQKYKKVD